MYSGKTKKCTTCGIDEYIEAMWKGKCEGCVNPLIDAGKVKPPCEVCGVNEAEHSIPTYVPWYSRDVCGTCTEDAHTLNAAVLHEGFAAKG